MDDVRIAKPQRPLSPEVLAKLSTAVERCPDVAFAHLPEVRVGGDASTPNLVLFAWLKPESMGSLRSALNLVSDAVGGALPQGEFVDVVILNSAPELLEKVEEAGCLLVEPDPGERRRAVAASQAPESDRPQQSGTSRWWPF